MRKLKALIFVVLVFTFGIFNVSDVSAASDYTIDEYEIDMVVNENNTFDITEKITANFNIQKHGIFRTLPLYNKVKRADGTESKNRVKISNIKVSDEFKKSTENGNLKLKIGDPDKTLTGKKSYVISYNYNIGKDTLEGKDELYYNLIGNDWDTTISKFKFTITMPKEFDKEKLGFSSGRYGTVGTNDVFFYVFGNKISGQHLGALKAGESVTVRLELPDGYFVGAGIEPNKIYYFFYAVPILGAIYAAYLWAKYGKDRKTFVKPEYFPPKGANSLEVGFLYKGNANSKDVISLLIYLANKGYLTISETEEKGVLSKKKGFKLKKIKNYDGNNKNEKLFLEGLFKSGDEVTASDLYDEFYKTTQKIIANQNSRENKEKIFEKNGKRFGIVILLILISHILITIPPFLDYGDYEDMIIALFFPGAALIDAVIEPFYLIGFLVGALGVIVMVVFAILMPKRTEYGTEKLAEVKGLKEFLTSVEKERIEKMVEENPNYFYDILPFAYVLGVSDKWIEKFEDMNLKAPDWYDNHTAFNMVMFNSFMHSTMATATTNMSSTSSHSSSSGGGGFSGGGSGGGGGGSW